MDLSVRPFRIRMLDRELRAHSVVIATGATAKRLGLPSEGTFWARGISACAICDGASPLFKRAEVAVAGGGDSATEEAVYLTKYAKHVSNGSSSGNSSGSSSSWAHAATPRIGSASRRARHSGRGGA